MKVRPLGAGTSIQAVEHCYFLPFFAAFFLGAAFFLVAIRCFTSFRSGAPLLLGHKPSALRSRLVQSGVAYARE